MYEQMNIFDYIDKPRGNEKSSPHTQFEQMFEKVEDPIWLCSNCLCEYCTNNVEQPTSNVKPGEMLEPCFNCDECRVYSGESRHANQQKENCPNFIMSDYGAQKNRNRFRIIKG